MDFKNINSQFVDWDTIEGVINNGQTGTSLWKEVYMEKNRIGLAEYSAEYKSAEWCEKGHILYCIEGKLIIRLKSGEEYTLCSGNSLTLGEKDHHIAITGVSPAKIFVVD